jgi:hypothetical protein
MASKMFSLLSAPIRQRLRDILLGVSAVALASLFLAISMGFGALALYVHLSTVEGRSIAALIVCGAYGPLAIAILILWAWSRGAFRLRRATAIVLERQSASPDF